MEQVAQMDFMDFRWNYPPKYQNTDVWVIDPVTKESWSRSLEDPSTESEHNSQFRMEIPCLLLGAMCFGRHQFTTYNALSALDLPSLVNWVKGTDSSLASNAILQTPGDVD